MSYARVAWSHNPAQQWPCWTCRQDRTAHSFPPFTPASLGKQGQAGLILGPTASVPSPSLPSASLPYPSHSFLSPCFPHLLLSPLFHIPSPPIPFPFLSLPCLYSSLSHTCLSTPHPFLSSSSSHPIICSPSRNPSSSLLLPSLSSIPHPFLLHGKSRYEKAVPIKETEKFCYFIQIKGQSSLGHTPVGFYVSKFWRM